MKIDQQETAVDAVLWKSLPIFVSSTFEDMHAERNHLQNVVFPELAERLVARRCTLEPIDLRIGIETTKHEDLEAKALEVLSVCLREIDQSRPFFVGILGDRYGWIPPSAAAAQAAREVGFHDQLAGLSICEIELRFGVLDYGGNGMRSQIFLRESFVTDRMPPEVTAEYGGKESSESVASLRSLKARLYDSVALQGRVHSYRLAWSEANHQITGIEEWGQIVLEALWRDFDEETSHRAREHTTPRAEEQAALDWFLHYHQNNLGKPRKFTTRLYEFATGFNTLGSAGVFVHGAPGSGKSSCFASLYNLLTQSDALVLAHSAGISKRSGEVDSMLQTWIAILQDHLEAQGFDFASLPAQLDARFGALLTLVSRQRRVVILVDALNRFERTDRAHHMTWVPRLWPPNARLIVTGVPEPVALQDLQTFLLLEEIEPLDSADCRSMVRQIGQLYHRNIAESTIEALLEKRDESEGSVASNPLWLELMLHELNILGEKVVPRPTSAESSATDDQIVAFLKERVRLAPTTIEGLYQEMLARIERSHGRNWVAAFAICIAQSHAGWRDTDLKHMVPAVAKVLQPALDTTEWSDRKLAVLRRSLRNHLRRHSHDSRWDWSRPQTREAIRTRYLEGTEPFARINATMAAYLTTLADSEPIKHEEYLTHLIASRDDAHVVEHLTGDLSERQRAGAFSTIAERLMIRGGGDEYEAFEWFSTLVQLHNVPLSRRAALCSLYLYGIDPALEPVVSAKGRILLLTAISAQLSKCIDTADPVSSYRHDRSTCANRIGDALLKLGQAEDARFFYQLSLNDRIDRNEAVKRTGLDDGVSRHAVAIGHQNISDALLNMGDTAAASQASKKALAIVEELATANPEDLTLQRDFSVSLSKCALVEANPAEAVALLLRSVDCLRRLLGRKADYPLFLEDLSITLEELGDMYHIGGEHRASRDMYEQALHVAEQLLAMNRGDLNLRRRRALAQDKLSLRLSELGVEDEARELARASLESMKYLAEADPTNEDAQRALAVSYERIGDREFDHGEIDSAADAFQAAMQIRKRLLQIRATRFQARKDYALSLQRLGDIERARDRNRAALGLCQEAHDLLLKCLFDHEANSEVAISVVISSLNLGGYHFELGNDESAYEAYDFALSLIQSRLPDTPNVRQIRVQVYLGFGRLLERKGDWKDALRAYESARRYVTLLLGRTPDHPAFVEANRRASAGIQRVRRKQ